MPIKLIAIDLDGTLLDNQSRVSARNAAVLREAVKQGIRVVMATSRRLYSVRRYAVEIGISEPVICSDGAHILATPDGPEWAVYTVPPEIALEIAQLADLNGWELTTVIGQRTFFKQRPGQTLGKLDEDVIVYATHSEGMSAAPTRILTHDPQAISAITALITEQYHDHEVRLQPYHHHDGTIRSLGVFPKQADKAAALDYVCTKLNISLQDTMAIGDGDNDLRMLARAGCSIAMGNAREVVRQQARWTAPSNEDDGVAWAIEKFALSGASDGFLE